jgi:predicted permease
VQVSPYNLWTVRFVRYITVFLTIITTIWWAALLVSTFVTPPGLHARAGTFLSFSYTSVALAELIVILMTFAAPSLASRIMIIVIAIFLLIDVIVIAAVRQTRHEELWIGIASSICEYCNDMCLIVNLCHADLYRDTSRIHLDTCR